MEENCWLRKSRPDTYDKKTTVDDSSHEILMTVKMAVSGGEQFAASFQATAEVQLLDYGGNWPRNA